MAFIRVVLNTGAKIDLNVDHVVAFQPLAADKKQTFISLIDGSELTSSDSAQAIRGAIRRALAPVAKAE